MQVNAKELRLHLTDYLKRVARGHSLKVSMRGKPIAQLSPIQGKAEVEEDDLFGIWADRKDLDVDAHVRGMRQGRKF